jgi:hypothetical protein
LIVPKRWQKSLLGRVVRQHRATADAHPISTMLHAKEPRRDCAGRPIEILYLRGWFFRMRGKINGPQVVRSDLLAEICSPDVSEAARHIVVRFEDYRPKNRQLSFIFEYKIFISVK